MSLTAAQIRLVVEECHQLLVGGKVRKVWCGNDLSFVLEARLPGKNLYLLYSLEERAVRLQLASGKSPQPERPTDFVMLLRKYLIGGRMLGMEQVGNDRVVRLEFEKRVEPESDPADSPAVTRLTLLAELTGRHGNIFLLDASSKILGSLLPNHSYRRKLIPGEPYVYPATPRPEVSSAMQDDALDLSSREPDGGRSVLIETHYQRKLTTMAAVQEALDLLRRLRSTIKSLVRRRLSIQRDLERAREAQKFRRWAELLQSAYGKIPRGKSSAEVPDYYEENMPLVTVPLDEKLSLEENIERYFQRYKKYHAATDAIEKRLHQTEEKLQTLQQALERAESLAHHATTGEVGSLKATTGSNAEAAPRDPEAARQQLVSLRADLEKNKLLRQKSTATSQKGRRTQARALPYREFRSASGKTILVGKGGRHNDALTLRIARGSDLWLHAHDWAGAHVVVRLERNEDIDQQSLMDAATLAAHYSKARSASKVEVIYTRAKHVSKPKGLPPGRVTVANIKTFLVRIEEERVARLMEKRD